MLNPVYLIAIRNEVHRTTHSTDALRQLVRFDSGDSYCEAWRYPGHAGGCVVMGAGLAVTKEPGTDRMAKVFNDAPIFRNLLARFVAACE